MEIIVCDDHRLFGEALSSVLEFHGHEVVGCVTTAGEAVSLVAERPVDTVVLDLRFPEGWSFDAIEEISSRSPSTDIVVLTGAADDGARQKALAMGARVCVDKSVPVREVIDVVERREMNGCVVAPARRPVESQQPWTAASLGKFLTPREREVLEGLVEGVSTSALAESLGVGHATARTHVQNLLAKLGVHSRLEAVLFAVEHNLVQVPSAKNTASPPPD